MKYIFFILFTFLNFICSFSQIKIRSTEDCIVSKAKLFVYNSAGTHNDVFFHPETPETDSLILHQYDRELNNEALENLLKLISKKSVNHLLIGLSKCHIPHHAAAFYNPVGEFIFAIHICFYCESIRLEKNSACIESINFQKYSKNISNTEIKKSEILLNKIKQIISDEGQPVGNNPEYYKLLTR